MVIPGSARVGFLGDSGDSSGFVDEPSPMALPATPLSASSSISEGWKYSSQKILWKLKPKYMHFSHASSTSASSSTDSAWRSQDSATWRSVDGSEVVLRGSRLETLSAAERAALRSVATATLARMLPGISLHRQKDAFQTLRMKRQKLMKATRLGIGGSEVTRRPSSCSTDDERRSVFGAPLSAALEWERGQDAESR
ncbi:unnamed protein product, partial [Mesorhabditis belari]|uniref:Uncharacterized protein n=1 Tax=Mesorhabditis belari TaxID=2138241 RepID=A0AAF3F6D1_9BILA